MAGIDTSMYGNLVPAPAIDPIGSMNKALAARNLISESQIHNVQAQQASQQYNDSLAMRQAQDNNTKVNPDGSYSIDQNKMLSDLGQTAPHLVPQAVAGIMQQKQAMQEFQMKQIQDHATIASQTLSGIHDQDSLDQAKVTATQLGYDTSHWPQNYDTQGAAWIKDQAKNAAYAAMNPKDAMSSQQEQQKIGLQGQEVENKRQELALSQGKDVNSMAQEMKNDLDANRSRAGNFGDISARYLSGQRMNTLIGSFKNGNLPSQQMEELGLGMANMISGSSGAARSQVEAIVPSSIIGNSQKLKQWLKNDPQGANQQKFVDMMGHTINREMDMAQQQLNQIRTQRLPAYSRLKNVAPEVYNSIIEGYGMGGSPQNTQSAAPASSAGQSEQSASNPPPAKAAQFASDVLAYAQKHGITPEQAQSIKTQRMIGNK